MSVHVLLDTTFFCTSMAIAAQQRLVPIPANRGLNAGDTIFLRDESGALTWVTDVLTTGEFVGADAWSGNETPTSRYAITGYLARIHPGTVPAGKSRLQSPWVTLNKRTLENALPWWETHVLLYHSTLHLVEGLLTPDEVREGLRGNCLQQHASGHIIVPHGEARKRLLVHVKGADLQCGLCGELIASLDEATQDHVIPISQGGPDALSNIELTHRECNELKGNALPEQYPPIFPAPGAANGSANGRSFRNGRHVHHRRGGRRGPGSHPMRRTTPVNLPVRGTGVESVTNAAQAPAQPPLPPEQAKPISNEPTETKSRTPAQPVVEPSVRTEPTQVAPPSPTEMKASDVRGAGVPSNGVSASLRSEPAPIGNGQEKSNGSGNGDAPKNGVVEADPAWIDRVQKCSWQELIQLAGERDWAAKTAALRTLEQLPRGDGKDARTSGKMLVEGDGPKGRFRLVEWKDQIVLTEERGNRHNHYLVKRLNAISWETYIWYLTRFGRTTPLAVAMSLLPLWRQGTKNEAGLVRATKTGLEFEMRVQDDRLDILEQEQSPDVA